MANDKEDETDNGVPEESVSEEETQQSVSDEDGAVDDANEMEATDSVSDSDSSEEEGVFVICRSCSGPWRGLR